MNVIVQLIRHAIHDQVDRVLVGRSDAAYLSLSGLRQARKLGEQLARQPCSALQSSPRMRALQTARQLARSVNRIVDICPQMDELDTGEWTGTPFAVLARDQRWEDWNTHRATARIPGGESMGELKVRVVAHLERLRYTQSFGRVLIVSHAEPIRAAVLHYRGMSMDAFHTIRIDPASVTTLLLHDQGAELMSVNVPAQKMAAA